MELNAKAVGWFSSRERFHQAKVSIESYHDFHGHEDTSYYFLFCGKREDFDLDVPDYVAIVYLDQSSEVYTSHADTIGVLGGWGRTLILDYMARRGHPKVMALDADMETFGRLDDLWLSLDEHDIIVTPHRLTYPPLDGKTVTQELFSFYGNYNSAFFMMRQTPESMRFLEWWNVMSLLAGEMNFSVGRCAEQGWLRFVADYVPRVRVLRDIGVNMAFWRWDREDMMEHRGGRWLIDGVPLRVFHYSHFDPDDLPASIEKHQNRAKCSPVMLEFLARYRAKLFPGKNFPQHV